MNVVKLLLIKKSYSFLFFDFFVKQLLFSLVVVAGGAEQNSLVQGQGLLSINSYPAGRPFSDTFTVLECASCYAYRGILRTAIAAIPIYGAAHIDSFTLASQLVCLAIAVSMHSQQAIGSYSYSDPGCSGCLSRSNKQYQKERYIILAKLHYITTK